MLITAPTRILVAREAVDFRKQIDGLAALCEVELRESPLDGTLFVFRNRRNTALKMLIWTHGGFLLLYKKLERGRFRWPEMSADRRRITSAELAALLEGIDLSRCRRLGRWNPKTGVESVRDTG
ncbi:MAG: IS66 family insertion sequence element accessory protein TnpB [Alphaproteobacteria bacterium]|nr:IS66 family insertion sequence element accessory protein TnpB [Alphaproteobacteria bacterium]MCB9765458.1 IS66 family insertion sequence element accessory protein TnpB [Alphaproteobacteria bacterium]